MPAFDAAATPECVNAPMGYESLPALLRGLLGAKELRWQGSVVARNAFGDSLGVLRCKDGQVSAGYVGGAPDLLEAVIGVCSDRELREVAFVRNVDLVSGGSEVTPGPVDVLQLTAAILRRLPVRECVTAAVQFIGSRSLIIRGKLPLERYGFTSPERAVVESLRGAPHTLAEIDREAILPRDAVERIVCTLWFTRAITLAPAWLRTISNAMDQPTMSLFPPRSDADDPTLIVTPEPKRSSSYSERAPAQAVTEFWESPRRSQCPPPSGAPLQAQTDQHFEAAEVLLSRGYPREAVLEAQKGMRLCRPRPAQEALYAWALYQRAGAGRAVQPHVWEHLENALRADPNCELARRYWALLPRDEEPG
jgi:hypothetical protein